MSAQSAADLCRRADELKSEKHNWENIGQVCAKYCLPAKANITETKAEGQRTSSEVYNSIPIEAAQICSAGLQQYLATGRFFQLEFEDPELNENDEAADWLYEEQEGIYSVLNNSNYENKNGEFFRDLPVLPGATLYSEPDPEDIIRFESIPFEEVLISVNHRGRVDELHRIFQYNVRQAFTRWGEKCGPEISELYKKGKWTQKFTFLHSVGPRHVRVVGKKDSYNMEYYDCYTLMDKKRKIAESGHRSFPFVVGRWATTTGQTWAYTPASIGIADILMLNNMDMTVLMAGQMATSPPWLFPDENFVAPLNMNPFAINYRIPNPAGTTQNEKDPMALVANSNMPIGLELLQAREDRIKRYFFNDLFLPLLEKTATAYEVAKVIEKKMGILGGVIGGITKDILGPSINRARIIRREHPLLQKQLKTPPPSVQGQNVRINYISPLVIAQKAAQEQNLEAFLAAVAQVMQVNPSVRHKVKWDVAIDKMSKNRAIDPDVLASDNEYKEAVEADRQAEANAQQIMMAHSGGQAMKSVGEGAQALAPATKKAKKK
jgi:hypothetical protein